MVLHDLQRKPHCLRSDGPLLFPRSLTFRCHLNLGVRAHRLIALITACMLIGSMAVFSAHAIGDPDHGRTQCDLCEHFTGTAGSPAQVTVIGKPVLVVHVAPPPRVVVLPTRPAPGLPLPRGPPAAEA